MYRNFSVLFMAIINSSSLKKLIINNSFIFQVCFLCMKSRFGFFSRGQKCELCKQQICNKCAAKVFCQFRVNLEGFLYKVFSMGSLGTFARIPLLIFLMEFQCHDSYTRISLPVYFYLGLFVFGTESCFEQSDFFRNN
jgi:hypothetical protein